MSCVRNFTDDDDADADADDDDDDDDNFFVCGPKFITWPGKVWLEYFHYPRSYRGAHAKL